MGTNGTIGSNGPAESPHTLTEHGCENGLSPLKEMQFTSDVPKENSSYLLVPTEPLDPVDQRNHTIPRQTKCENSLSPFNEMHCTNGVPME